MKATIEFDDELYRQLKAAAALRGRKIKDLVAEGVALVLSGKAASSLPKVASLPLIESGPPGTLDIPDDIGYAVDLLDDRVRDAASLR